jgi:hypothetical protein
MRQSGDYRDDEPLTPDRLQQLLRQALDDLDVEKARREVRPFHCGPACPGPMVAGFFQPDHPSNQVDLIHVENRIKEGGRLVPFIC